jgi:hypothetical protein
MKNILLPAFLILFSLTQNSCSSASLNAVDLNAKFNNMVSIYEKNEQQPKNNNPLNKPGYSKEGLSQNENQLTENLTESREFQVNRFGTGNGHGTPVVAMNNSSNFVVTWKQQTDIFAQIYDSRGVSLGEEFMVNNPQHIIYDSKNSPEYIKTMDSPKVAIDDRGNFIIAWERLQRSFDSNKDVTVRSDIFARSFNSEGKPLNEEFKVNTSDEQFNKAPAIARNGNGDFIISWSSFKNDNSQGEIYARKFTASAQALNEFIVTANIAENCEGSVAISNEGKFAVSWYNLSDNNIYASLFQNNGVSQGKPFRVNNSIDGDHGLPKVAMDKAGNFVITWQKTSGDGSYFGVFARRYGSEGLPTGSEFRVNNNTNNPYDQYEPAIAMNTSGNFVITWQNLNENYKGEAGIFAQKFSNSGNKLGAEFLVKTYSGVEKAEPSAAIDKNNNFIIAWANSGIHAKMFDNNNF